MILADVFYRYAAVRPALLPNGKRGFRAAIQGLHALSLASLDAIRINGDGKPPPFQALRALSDYQKQVPLGTVNTIR